ncbi:MAG: 8-oxo-dGTP diphosphatase MutT [Candidatus Izimaplasma sp.]|nr:8-oxo-dGTP diphosphatase MutT [Candidatus Izimaplasma bacterium]
MKTIEVVAAIIKKDNKILCTQRADDGRFLSLKWEFPGGKIEKGETHQQALKREIQEELKLDIDVNDLFITIKHTYPNFNLIMHAYLCEMKEEKITLKEHNNYKWLSIYDLDTLDWAEADIPIANKLLKINMR